MCTFSHLYIDAMDKENMKPKLKQRKKSYRKFYYRRKNDVRNRVADGKKMMATKPLNTHSTCPSVADKSTKGQQHSSEPTSTNMLLS